MEARLDPYQKILVAGVAPRIPAIARSLRALLGGVSFADCESAGYEALVRAALRYDPATGVPFMAFAFQRVRGAMLDAARDADPDRRRMARSVRLAVAAECVAEAQAPLAGDPRTLAERVAAAVAMVRDVTAAAVLGRVGDAEALGDPDGVDLDQRLVDDETRRRLQAALGRCEPDERRLIEALYFRGETMHAVAEAMGVHVSTVSRRHARALRRLSGLFAADDG